VVITTGDVHKVERRGHYADGNAYYNAVNAPEKLRFGQIVNRRYDPVQEAADRERRAFIVAAEQEALLAAKPYICWCKSRYANERGLAQHIAICRRQEGRRAGMLLYVDHDTGAQHYLNPDYAEHIQVGDVGRACELHMLHEVYVPPPTMGLRIVSDVG
jgi:hypothetical protein